MYATYMCFLPFPQSSDPHIGRTCHYWSYVLTPFGVQGPRRAPESMDRGNSVAQIGNQQDRCELSKVLKKLKTRCGGPRQVATAANEFKNQTTNVVSNGVQNIIRWLCFKNTTRVQGHVLFSRRSYPATPWKHPRVTFPLC